MTASKTRVDYPQLQRIADQFRAEGRAHGEMTAQLRRGVAVLRAGGWVGVAADAFYAEMDGIVMPSLNRLVEAFERAGVDTRAISAAYQAAEHDAAAVLRIGDTAVRPASAAEVPAPLVGAGSAPGSTGAATPPAPERAVGGFMLPAALADQIAALQDDWNKLPGWLQVMIVVVAVAQPNQTPALLEVVKRWSTLPDWAKEIIEGVFAGDFDPTPSIIGTIAQVIVGFIPVVGQIADIRDIIAGIIDVVKEAWTEGKVPWLAIVFLAISIIAIVPGADVLKAFKVLKPLLKAMGEKPLRALLEHLMRNPQDIGRIGKVVWTLASNPQLVEVLAKHGDKASDLLTRGTPELVEALAKNPQLADEIVASPKALEYVLERGPDGVEHLKNYDKALGQQMPGGQSLLDQDGITVTKSDGTTTDLHTVDRHVGKSEDWLRERIRRDGLDDGASTFSDLGAAERTVLEAVRTDAAAVQRVVSGASDTTKIFVKMPDKIGTHIADPNATATATEYARVVLVKDPTSPNGYRVLTAFPVTAQQHIDSLTHVAKTADEQAVSLDNTAKRLEKNAADMATNASKIRDPVKRAEIQQGAAERQKAADEARAQADAARKSADAAIDRRDQAIREVNSPPPPSSP
jgi:WXG100 family type VII secretion target